MHIGILQCDSVDPSLQSEYGDYPDMHRRLLTANTDSPVPTFSIYDLTRNQFPESPEACDAWLFTGSKWSTYDSDDWIIRAQRLARQLHDQHRPTVGICFGHQLICQALGGTVEKSDAGWGVGVHTMQIRERRPWMEPYRDTLSLLVSHQDQVIEPPAEASPLAGHAFCPYDMLQIGEHLLTLQGHPEFPKGYARAVMDRRREVIGKSTYREGIASLDQAIEPDVAASWILNFLRRAVGAA